MDVGAARLQESNNLERRGFTRVTDVRLVGDADDQYPGSLDALLSVVESVHDFGDDVLGHVAVDLTREFDKPRLKAVRSGFPRKIEGVHWDAVAAEARPGIERHKSEGLGCRSVNDLPHVQIEAVAHQG
jgi:hypothetical protein